MAKPPGTHDPADQTIGYRLVTHRVFHVEQRLNPVGVAKIIAAIPKVAEYGNLGLWATTTSWLIYRLRWWIVGTLVDFFSILLATID